MHTKNTITFLFLVIALAGLSGCELMESRVLGARVHAVTHQGITYTHCSITMSSRQPEMARDAIKQCSDAIGQNPLKP